MKKYREKIKEWLILNSEKKLARSFLRIIAFAESSFFPIPPDPFLAGLVLIKPKKWFKFSLDVTIYSVLGGVFGYLLGYWFFDSFGPYLINLYHLTEEFEQISTFFLKYGFWSVFIAAFTPIPYKVFTISAGLFGINIIAFVVASIIGRGLRFFFVGWLFRYVGEKYSHLVLKYFNIISLFLGILIIFYLIYKFI